jgi:hypothetical protein
VNRKRLALVALIPLLALAGCGGPGHDETVGSVTQLRFTPAHDADVKVNDYTTVCTPVTVSNGTSVSVSTVCTEQYAGWHWETRHHPDKWVAYAFNCNDREECWDFHREISQSVYCHLRPGYWVDFEHPAVYLDLSETTLREEASCHGTPAT